MSTLKVNGLKYKGLINLSTISEQPQIKTRIWIHIYEHKVANIFQEESETEKDNYRKYVFSYFKT